MHIGIQMVTPNGYLSLQKDVVYYFTHSDTKNDRILLVRFLNEDFPTDKCPEKPILLYMPRSQFEYGLTEKKIIPLEKQRSLPAWLAKLEGVNFNTLDLLRKKASQSLFERVSQRLTAIQPLLQQIETVLAEKNPERYINRYSRECTPPQNENRIKLWLFTYLLHGSEFWSLTPNYANIGQWDRSISETGMLESASDRQMSKTGKERGIEKRGRPSIRKGKHSGYNVTDEVRAKIIEGYIKYSSTGVIMGTIYARTMTDQFKCIVRTDKFGKSYYVQPDGKKIPSEYQFVYHVNKHFGRIEVKRGLYGDKRIQETRFESKGSFTNNVAMINERYEADGYYVQELPCGIIEGSSLQALCVVRGVDAATGVVCGIGFTLGKETANAYKSMLFCMAIGKVKFCSLFNIKITESEWPGIGLPAECVIDRGPAAGKQFLMKAPETFHIKTITPSNRPKSKALVEASHPRNRNFGRELVFIPSEKSPVVLAKREIYQVIKDNRTSNVSDRMTPEMFASYVPCNPIGIWNFLDERCRTVAQPISFSEAVRQFLMPVQFTLKNDGLYFFQFRFDSPQLRATGIFNKVPTGNNLKIDGYVLELCVRHAWVEVNHQIIEIDAVLGIRDDKDQLFLSLSELAEVDRLRKDAEADHREHRRAAQSDIETRFQADTGLRWDSPVQLGRGKRNRSPIANQEMKEAQKATFRKIR